MNLYGDIPTLRSRLGISGTSEDATLAAMLEAASRYVDSLCGRYFYTRYATIEHDTSRDGNLLLLGEDCLSLSSLSTDSEADGTFDGETWTEDTDFVLVPYERFPKYAVRVLSWGNYGLARNRAYYVRATGVWGYGDGESASPWEDAGVTVTVDASSETLAVSAANVLLAGQTIQVGDEQIYISEAAEDAVEITGKRGANGTTAAAHNAVSASVAQYPSRIQQAAYHFASRFYRQLGAEEFYSEGIGDYRYTRFATDTQRERDKILVSRFFRKGRV